MGKPKRRSKNGKFIMLPKSVYSSDAYKVLSGNAIVVLLFMIDRQYPVGNGRFHASHRVIALETGRGLNVVARCLDELKNAGFLVITERGSLGSYGMGNAHTYRLTFLTTDHDGKPPTMDFLKTKPHPQNRGDPTPKTGMTARLKGEKRPKPPPKQG